MSTPGTILTLMAHPDDAEILCGGILCLLRERGWDIHIATATPGDCGSATLGPEEIAAIRREEGCRSAERLGGTYHCLEMRDLCVVYDAASAAAAVALLRRVRPDVVITHSPSDYMLDHEEISRIARAACFNAAIPNAPVRVDGPSAPRDPPTGHVPALYYADPIAGVDPLGRPVTPHFWVDISRVIDEKAALLACHASQRDWLRRHHGIDEYIEGMRRWSADRGQLAGLGFAEGLRQHRGHGYDETDRLGAALTGLVREVVPPTAPRNDPR